MSERKRGARETRSSSSSLAAGGAAASGGGAAMSSAKKAKQSLPAPPAAESNGHPSAIIAPRCTYASSKGAEECPHIMVRGICTHLFGRRGTRPGSSKEDNGAQLDIFFLVRCVREPLLGDSQISWKNWLFFSLMDDVTLQLAAGISAVRCRAH